ncbi:SigE family RNA polymerase sigma factor [Micromonospora sp. KC606]|uniref:SigE family RNA polymerase sigma factor n=1 Tax=Micromonospora sp. KC606 TaxID=2530379 RepID=UPI00104C7117|nr:SigE family RNA polymerase sigma factor [Micromonospora sp. KC606]TDC80122.1 SigE family RNA polymerase sigma factor [Micromonospora sp. KC606]
MADVTDGEFTTFINERGDKLLRVAYALAGSQHAAEDLLQHALAKAYARWPRIRGDAEPYVKRILYHDQVSIWRRARRSEIPVANLPERMATGPDPELRLLLREALRALPPRQRAVLTLRYLEDLSVAETATLLGCRAGTVASQTAKALARLRQLVPGLDEMTPRAEVTR